MNASWPHNGGSPIGLHRYRAFSQRNCRLIPDWACSFGLPHWAGAFYAQAAQLQDPMPSSGARCTSGTAGHDPRTVRSAAACIRRGHPEKPGWRISTTTAVYRLMRLFGFYELYLRRPASLSRPTRGRLRLYMETKIDPVFASYFETR